MLANLTSRSAKAATGQLVKAPDCDQSQAVLLYDYGLRSGPLRAVMWMELSTGSREASCLSVDFLVLEVLKKCVLCVCSVETCVWWKMEDASETKCTPSGLINLKPTSPGATTPTRVMCQQTLPLVDGHVQCGQLPRDQSSLELKDTAAPIATNIFAYKYFL